MGRLLCVGTGPTHVDSPSLKIPGPGNAICPPPSALTLPGTGPPRGKRQQVHRGGMGRAEAVWSRPGGTESGASGPTDPLSSLKQSSPHGRS